MTGLKFNLIRHFVFRLLLLSVFIAAVISFLLRNKFYPYQLEVLETISDTNIYRTYHDFDKDGFSEKLEINNIPGSNRYFIHIKNWSEGIIDQTNYWERFDPYAIMFTDITGDGYDEIFTFTHKADSLYLYVHDLIAKKAIINRLFLACLEEPLTPEPHEAGFLLGKLANHAIYGHNVIIFAIRSFSTLKPRTIYALDLESKQIIRKFETHSTLSALLMYDLTGDGLDEIIVTGLAYGNVPYPAKYRDDKCWLFVLDQKLVPLFPPLSFSEYPAAISCQPIEINTERFLLVIPDYLGTKKIDNSMYLINYQGKIHLRTQNIFRESMEYAPVVSTNKNPSEIYGWREDNGLIKLDHQFNLLHQISTHFKKIRPVICKDLNGDGNEEVICTSENFLTIFDQELKLLSRFPVPDRSLRIDFRENGTNQPLEIGLNTHENFYRLSHVKNKFYSLFPLIFIGFTGFITLLLIGIHKMLALFNIYARFFKYFTYDSIHGMIIVNHQGKILYTNDKLHLILNITTPLSKGDNIFAVLSFRPQIKELFYKSVSSSRPVKQKIFMSDKDLRPEIEIGIKPLHFFTKNGTSYLMQFKTMPISSDSDKIQIWSRAVQKMAHDIKTPLSTVALNLKVLQTRLDRIQLPESNRQELSDDINMMRTELQNIQIMTKNFLKFSNLDKPHFQAFDIRKTIENVLTKYQPYLNADLDIQLSVDSDIKPVWADSQQIEIVFNILVENALASLQGRGLINISVVLAQYLDRSFSDYLEVEVADTGAGIKESDKSKIFEPYYTTKQEGTGMGLAIAKKIIEDHNGTIDVYSKSNFGAVFRFSLPVIKEEDKNA